MDGNKIDH